MCIKKNSGEVQMTWKRKEKLLGKCKWQRKGKNFKEKGKMAKKGTKIEW